MISTIDDIRTYVETDETDDQLEARMRAIEGMIRAYTHNHFLLRPTRTEVDISAEGLAVTDGAVGFQEGDTVELCHTTYSDGLHVVEEALTAGAYTLSDIRFADSGLMYLVQYPKDVVMGALAMLRYDLETADTVGVASETISRHSVTYRDASQGNSLLGYPLRLTSFLMAYRRTQ